MDGAPELTLIRYGGETVTAVPVFASQIRYTVQKSATSVVETELVKNEAKADRPLVGFLVVA